MLSKIDQRNFDRFVANSATPTLMERAAKSFLRSAPNQAVFNNRAEAVHGLPNGAAIIADYAAGNTV